MSRNRVGIVLSGGGAKGAYQVGVIKALVELGTEVDAVAGASIGALNGAILASSPSLHEGARRLEEVWLTLAESSPLSSKMPNYLSLLASMGMHFNGFSYIDSLVKTAKSYYGNKPPAGLQQYFQIADALTSGVLSDAPLHRLIDQYIDTDALANGLPLYVSVFRSRGAIADLFSCISSELGFSDSQNSEFLHIQSLRNNEQREALMASAAIPLLFAPKRVNDALYSDGGQGGWSKMQGNTPISPLLQAGYKMVIVTHLCDGSLWSRQDFPTATVLEIRPISSIHRDGGIKDLLGFDARKIPSWIQQGYEDTLLCVGRVINSTKARNELRVSESALIESEAQFKSIDTEMAKALARLQQS